MSQILTSLNYIPIVVLTLGCFLLGGLWYSPLLFAKAWIKEMKFTPEDLKKKGNFARTMGGTFVLSLISTTATDILITIHHSHSLLSGAEMGLLIGVGLVATREGTNALFEGRTLKHYLIVAGHDVVLFVLLGAILAVWR